SCCASEYFPAFTRSVIFFVTSSGACAEAGVLIAAAVALALGGGSLVTLCAWSNERTISDARKPRMVRFAGPIVSRARPTRFIANHSLSQTPTSLDVATQ